MCAHWKRRWGRLVALLAAPDHWRCWWADHVQEESANKRLLLFQNPMTHQ